MPRYQVQLGFHHSEMLEIPIIMQQRYPRVDGCNSDEAVVRAARSYALPARSRTETPGGDMQFQ